MLFLDDDAQMSSRILSDLIYALETEPDVLIASGWPNDYLPPDAAFTPTFASFMLLGYRVLSHLSMGTLYPTVLWGGCLLLRRSELLDPQIGIIEAWRQSGYSDDMIMIGRARKAQRKIVIPPSAFLPSKIERDYSLQRHVNYIRRQMFVCGTYHDIYDRINNLFLLTVVSIVFVLFGCFNFQLLVLHSVFGILKTIGTSPEALLPGNLIQPQQCGQIQASPAALYLLVLIAAGLWMYSVTSCYRSVISVGEYIAGKGFAERSSSMGETVQFSVLLFFGLAAQCALQAIAAAVAFFSDSIVWSGVRYFKRKGHVSAVYRTAKDGTPYTVEIEKARQEAYASYAQGSGHAVEEAEGEGGRGQKKDVASSRNGEDHTSRVVAGCI